MCPGVNWIDFTLGALLGAFLITAVAFVVFVLRYDDDGGLG
jgi:hypothetical protein